MLLVDAYSLLFRSGGVFLSYLVYGIYQEKITKTKYGPGKELFDFYFSLLFFQCVVNFIFSRIGNKPFDVISFLWQLLDFVQNHLSLQWNTNLVFADLAILLQCTQATQVLRIIISGEALPFVEFIKRHLHILSDMSIFGLTSAIGQMFLFGLITNFSPLTCSIVTTTRKFFTVLFSVALFGNSMTTFQWVGTALIFSGLLLDQVWGKTRSKQSSNSAKNINGTVNSVTS
ncbi:Solute carrier family 35 member B1 [Schistosoma japonicum]|nr:Solute carrier family 35 member B1 [Schistosoma japonicum]